MVSSLGVVKLQFQASDWQISVPFSSLSEETTPTFETMSRLTLNSNLVFFFFKLNFLNRLEFPIGSMYAIYGNIYHQYTPNVSIYTIRPSFDEESEPRYAVTLIQLGQIHGTGTWSKIYQLGVKATRRRIFRWIYSWFMIAMCFIAWILWSTAYL